MDSPTLIEERCPGCGKRLHAKLRSGQRITMTPGARSAKAQVQRLIVCLTPGCGYGREDTVTVDQQAPSHEEIEALLQAGRDATWLKANAPTPPPKGARRRKRLGLLRRVWRAIFDTEDEWDE
jgi:hypothetical protein